MAGALAGSLVLNPRELVFGGVAQRLDSANLFDSKAAFGHPFAICRSSEFVLHHGIDGNHCDTGGQLHRYAREAAAVDLNRGMLTAKNRDILVHDSRGQSDELVFRLAAEFG